MSETMAINAPMMDMMPAMSNCSMSESNNSLMTCYMDGLSDGGSVGGSGSVFATLRHDLFIIIITIAATCLAIAAYNYYLVYQLQIQKRQRDIENAKDDAFKDELIIAKQQKQHAAAQLLSNMGTASSTNSIAASLAHIEGMEASGNFLTAVLSQMWNHTNIAVSNTIKDALTPALEGMKLHFVKLDLGDVPITTKNMFIHRVDLETVIAGKKQKQAGIQIDVDVEWDGNCDIMLQATLTRSLKMTFGIRSLKLSGRMGILLSPLTTELPVISAVQYGFTNPPDVQLAFTGAAQKITSKLGFAQNALLGVIQSSLAGVMVLPQRLVMPVDLGSYDYLDTYQPPVGMIRVTAAKGRGFKMLQKLLLKDIPDIYCMISLGASKPFRTSTQYDNLTPSWRDESCDFILYDMDQKVYVEVFDEDKTPVDPDDPLGKAEISVRNLFRNEGRVELELVMDGELTKCFVTLDAELFHLSERVHSLNSAMYEGKNQLCGLLTVLVTKASDIHIPKEDAATYVKVVYGEGSAHEQTFYTGTVTDYPGIDALNPMFDSVFHVPMNATMMNNPLSQAAAGSNAAESDSPTTGSSSRGSLRSTGESIRSSIAQRMSMSGSSVRYTRNAISFTLIDSDGANGTKGHGELGKFTVSHESLMAAYKHTITETRPIGDGGSKLEFRVVMSGMETEEEKMQGIASPQSVVNDSFEDMPPASLYGGIEDRNGATIRVTAVRGRGFHIIKRRLGKKDDVPDVYCNIRMKSSRNHDPQLRNNSPAWQTSTIKDDTMPQWNESKDFSRVDAARDRIRVDVYDKNSKGTDEFLGSADFSVEKLLRRRLMEVELEFEAELTKSYVTLICIQLATTEEDIASRAASGNHAGFDENNDEDEDEEDDVVAPLRGSSPSSRPSPGHHQFTNLNMVSERNNNGGNSDDQSVGSTSSTSSRSRRMFNGAKKPFKKLGKKFHIRKGKSRKKREE